MSYIKDCGCPEPGPGASANWHYTACHFKSDRASRGAEPTKGADAPRGESLEADLRDFYDLTVPPADRLRCAARAISELRMLRAERDGDNARLRANGKTVIAALCDKCLLKLDAIHGQSAQAASQPSNPET